MVLEVDVRRLGKAKPAAKGRVGFAAAAAPRATDEPSAERVNPFTGTPACLAFGVLDSGGSLQERAMDHLRNLAPRLARYGSDPPEFLPDPHVIETSSGERIVHLRQHVHGIPVFQAMRLVRFDHEGSLLDVLGDHVPLRREEIDLLPSLDAAGAVLAAARHLAAPGGREADGLPGLRVSSRRPRVVSAFPLPAGPCVLRKPPFPRLIAVHQVLFYRKPDARLGWYVPLRLPDALGQYDLIVAANGEDAGEVLFCRNVVATGVAVALASRHNPQEEPARLLDMPQPLTAYPPFRPAGLPAGFPGFWVDRDRTEGGNVRCLRGGRTIRGASGRGRIVFQPVAGSDDLRAINAFFLCNFLHNFFYLLGFNEAAGNFQRINPAGVGRGGDELEVEIFGFVPGDASMLTEADGGSSLLSLGGIRQASGEIRHTALDADVVIHEFVHGVTARLVGGRGVWRPLISGPPQAQALDEGTSDYFALTLQNYLRRREGRAETLVYGAWSSGNPATGRRRASYAGFNERFSRLAQFPDPHDAGMVWCAALLAMNRSFGAVLGSFERGHELGWQLVVNALKQLPLGQDGPSFLDGRQAILSALQAMRSRVPLLDSGPLFAVERLGDLEAAVRRAFASLGMGRNAHSQGGTFAGLQDDFNP